MFAWEERAYALRDGMALPWSFAGYGPPDRFAAGLEVDALTPPSTVATLAAGYRPRWPDSDGPRMGRPAEIDIFKVDIFLPKRPVAPIIA